MANSSCANLITAVRARAARSTDTVLITTAFVLAALNEAQIDIVKKCPGQKDLFTIDKTSLRIKRWSTTATDVTVASRASTGIVTLTAAGHDLEVGDFATVVDVENDTDFSGFFEILSVSGNDVTYFQNLAADTGVGATFGTIVKTYGKAKYDISTINPAHISNIWILNAGSTRQQGITYWPKQKFDKNFLPISNEGAGEPTHYTREGNSITFNCPIASDYMGLQIRMDYTAFATAFDAVDSTATSDLLDSDEGLKLFALARVYDTLALTNPNVEAKALKTWALFEKWLSEYRDYNTICLEDSYYD